MGLGTAFSGDIKCDWCGRYMKNTDGGLTGVMGLDIVKRFGAATMKHYCSRSCKEAAKSAGGGGGGGSGGDSAAAEAAAARAREVAAIDEKIKNEGLASVQAINFDGDSKSIVSALSNLETIASGCTGGKESVKAVRKAVFSKMELGIRALRSTGDTENADYFEKHLKNMKRKAFFSNPVFWALVFIFAVLIGVGIYAFIEEYGIRKPYRPPTSFELDWDF
ncbi:MAG: hypothetical protein LBC80_09560 [Treponema sp.]|jgi:hypothetical protein|nr:hypothetical protein [Treponema sp.]